jgi:lipoprotein-anchoring transpeptidase ErfK/SrfK
MFYYKDWALHGAYWHNNFGHTMSHGCINMRQVDAEALFNWADGPEKGKKGTAVSVCDSFEGPGKCVQKDPVKI